MLKADQFSATPGSLTKTKREKSATAGVVEKTDKQNNFFKEIEYPKKCSD